MNDANSNSDGWWAWPACQSGTYGLVVGHGDVVEGFVVESLLDAMVKEIAHDTQAVAAIRAAQARLLGFIAVADKAQKALQN